MASSRKSQQSPKSEKRIGVALSGGLDSVVLLDTVCKAQAKNQPSQIYAFHIHHGLQKQADDCPSGKNAIDAAILQLSICLGEAQVPDVNSGNCRGDQPGG